MEGYLAIAGMIEPSFIVPYDDVELHSFYHLDSANCFLLIPKRIVEEIFPNHPRYMSYNEPGHNDWYWSGPHETWLDRYTFRIVRFTICIPDIPIVPLYSDCPPELGCGSLTKMLTPFLSFRGYSLKSVDLSNSVKKIRIWTKFDGFTDGVNGEELATKECLRLMGENVPFCVTGHQNCVLRFNFEKE